MRCFGCIWCRLQTMLLWRRLHQMLMLLWKKKKRQSRLKGDLGHLSWLPPIRAMWRQHRSCCMPGLMWMLHSPGRGKERRQSSMPSALGMTILSVSYCSNLTLTSRAKSLKLQRRQVQSPLSMMSWPSGDCCPVQHSCNSSQKLCPNHSLLPKAVPSPAPMSLSCAIQVRI